MKINEYDISKDDFIVLNETTKVEYEVKTSAELFVIKSPLDVNYKRFIDNRF